MVPNESGSQRRDCRDCFAWQRLEGQFETNTPLRQCKLLGVSLAGFLRKLCYPWADQPRSRFGLQRLNPVGSKLLRMSQLPPWADRHEDLDSKPLCSLFLATVTFAAAENIGPESVGIKASRCRPHALGFASDVDVQYRQLALCWCALLLLLSLDICGVLNNFPSTICVAPTSHRPASSQDSSRAHPAQCVHRPLRML